MLGFVAGTSVKLSGVHVKGSAICARPQQNGRKAHVVQMGVADRLKQAVDFGKVGQACATVALTMALMLAPTDMANAAGGGRAGGSNFRSAPSRSYSAPPQAGGGNVTIIQTTPSYGLFGPTLFPPFMPVYPVYGMGFSPILGTMVAVAAVAILVNSIRQGSSEITAFDRSTVSTIKIGLMSSARDLQRDLDMMARRVDTSTEEGLWYVLNESALSLLRNPAYWTHASLDSEVTTEPENAYGRRAMVERQKISEFTLSNVKGMRNESIKSFAREQDMSKAPSEYILVTLLVASLGKLDLPKNIENANDLREALEILGSVDESRLQAVEVLWSPQSMEDTLSKDEMLMDNPELRAL